MRISDWSSDVCSSDLEGFARAHAVGEGNEGDSDGQSERGVLGDQSLETGRHVIELGARDAGRDVDHQGHVLRVADDLTDAGRVVHGVRSEEHTSELQSLMRISYAVFCLKKKNITTSRYL